MANISDVEGIGPAYGEKLTAAGVRTLDALLATAGTKKGRVDLASQTGISETLILEWVNRADLARIKGVGSEYADLLEAAGVDSVVELSKRVPANLTAKMVEINEAKHLVRSTPSESAVTAWVEEAKTLERMVHH